MQRPHQDTLILSKSFKTAVDTFFSEASPLELNVPSDVRREIDERIRSVSAQAEPFLPPSAFDKVNHEASESLAISFKAFRKQVVRNADRNRGWFAMFLGITTWALGLIPTIVCAVLNKSRGWRALGIPLWWFGPVVALGGWGKVRSTFRVSPRRLELRELTAFFCFPDLPRNLHVWRQPSTIPVGDCGRQSGNRIYYVRLRHERPLGLFVFARPFYRHRHRHRRHNRNTTFECR